MAAAHLCSLTARYTDDMSQKTIKLRTHPRNFCGKTTRSIFCSIYQHTLLTLVCCIWNNSSHPAEEELIVNVDALAREKIQVAVGDIIEISVPHGTAQKYVSI